MTAWRAATTHPPVQGHGYTRSRHRPPPGSGPLQPLTSGLCAVAKYDRKAVEGWQRAGSPPRGPGARVRPQGFASPRRHPGGGPSPHTPSADTAPGFPAQTPLAPAQTVLGACSTHHSPDPAGGMLDHPDNRDAPAKKGKAPAVG